MIPDPIESLRDLLDRTPALSRADLEELAAAGRKLDDDPAFVADLIKSRFVENLLQAMDARGVNQSELARRWGKSRQYVSKVLAEDRRVNFTLESMAELCHLLGLRLDVRALPSSEVARGRATMPAESADLEAVIGTKAKGRAMPSESGQGSG